MKKIIFSLVMMVCLSAGLFAEGTQEVSSAGAGLIEEFTKTIQEGKDIVAEYAPLGIEGLVKLKAAYFKVIFPLLPLASLLGLIFIGFSIWCFLRDGNTYTELWGVGILFIIVGFIVLFTFGIWSGIDFVRMRMFEATPEVFVIKGLLGA